MTVSVISVKAVAETIHPSVDIVFEISYRDTFDYPISVKTIISSEDKRILGHGFEVPSKTAYQIPLKAFNYSQQTNRQNLHVQKTFRLTLDQKALDHIENLREKNRKHDVVLQLDLTVSYLEGRLEIGSYGTHSINVPDQHQQQRQIDLIKLEFTNPNTSQTHLRMLIPSQGDYSYLALRDEPLTISHTIKGSDWINDFQPQLGIGKFLVMEIPEVLSVSDSKDELGKRLHSATQRLKEIGELLRKGEWDDVAEDCRGIYEDLTKNYLPQFESSIKDLLRDTNGISDKGLNAFNEMIKNLGTYSHEFHHYRDEEGKAKQVTVNKEDAYALYVSLVGLVNMLTVKLHRQEQIESK
jgi:hypothetical protein